MSTIIIVAALIIFVRFRNTQPKEFYWLLIVTFLIAAIANWRLT